MAKKLEQGTRIRFASPKFNERKGIYENEYKKGVVVNTLLKEYEVYCEEDNKHYIVPQKACTKDYYFIKKNSMDNLTIAI